MSDDEDYLDTADRIRLLVRLAILYAPRLFNCPLEGKFPDRAFFEFLRDMYLTEFPLETHDACRLKGMLSRVSERSKARMPTCMPTTHRSDEQVFEDLWGQLRHVFDLLVCTKKMQVVEKDLSRATKVCSSGIEPESLLRPDQELSVLLSTMKNRLLATARERSRGHSLWLRKFKRDVSIQMEIRRRKAISCTPMSDDGDPSYDDEKDGDLSDDDHSTHGDVEDRDATFSPGSRATSTSSSSSAQDRIFLSSPFSSSAIDQAVDSDNSYCEDTIMTSRSPTPSPAKSPSSVHGLPRLRPEGSDSQTSNARFVPFESNTASIGPGDHCPSQYPPSSPLESTKENGATVEASGSKRNTVIYIDLTKDAGDPDSPVSEVFRASLSVGDQETPRSPTKRISPAQNSTFEAIFPNGWKVLETPRDGSCGLHAIVRSYKAQYPHHPPPTVEALRDVLDSGAMEGIMETLEASRFTGDDRPEVDFAYSNTDWFLQDHLAAILRVWGQQVGLNIALGIVTNNIPHLYDSDDTNAETIVVWIEHNENHYSGIAFESPCRDEDDEPPEVPALHSSTRSTTPRKSSGSPKYAGSPRYDTSPDTSYEMVEREEDSPWTKESTLPSPGSRPAAFPAESTTVGLVPEDSTPAEFDDFAFDFAFDAFFGDGSLERLKAPDPPPQPEDDHDMSDGSWTLRESSRSPSPQLGSPEPRHQYQSLEGCEKMESSDLIMSGALQPAPTGRGATPPTQRQLPTPRPSLPQKHAPLKRKNSVAARRHSGVPGMLSSFKLPHRPKDPKNTFHPPLKRQRHGRAKKPSPCPCCSRVHGRKGSHLWRRCHSE